MSGAGNGESNKESIMKDMSTIIKPILETHLMGRKFEEDKVKKWGNVIIDEIYKALSNKYPHYGYCIFFYISEKTDYLSMFDTVYYPETDVKIFENYKTDGLFSEIRIIATLIGGPINNFLNIVKDKELSSAIDKKICDHLEGRTYSYELFDKLSETICYDINQFLVERDNKPCSMHVCYFHKRPTKKIYIYYKFFNIKLHPLFFHYNHDSFTCRTYLFFIDN